jgi:lysophospholipase-3
MWKTQAADVGKNSPCYVDDIRAYQAGNKLNSPTGTEVRMNGCPKPGTDPDDTWKGGYDWRYGSIRPQDNPSMALYPQIAEKIEDAVLKSGKKVVIRGCSGGTINGYAFLMSQSQKWRDQYIMAFVAVSPVWGGTVSSLHSVLAGWKAGAMDICTGRAAALFIPSVYWMWPHPGTELGQWNNTEVIVTTPSKNYTANDFDAMLTDMGCGKGPKNLYDLEKKDLLQTFPPPLVDTYVFYGYGLATQAGFDIGAVLLTFRLTVCFFALDVRKHVVRKWPQPQHHRESQ